MGMTNILIRGGDVITMEPDEARSPRLTLRSSAGLIVGVGQGADGVRAGSNRRCPAAHRHARLLQRTHALWDRLQPGPLRPTTAWIRGSTSA